MAEPTARDLERARTLALAWHDVAQQGWEGEGPDAVDMSALANDIAEALADERERAARIAETIVKDDNMALVTGTLGRWAIRAIAAAIRAGDSSP